MTEEAAAFAAGADAELNGSLAVVAGSCGPGNLHFITGLFDANRNRVPVLAIASHIPSEEIGSGYFQETHPQELFRECSVYVEQVPDWVPLDVDTTVVASGVAEVALGTALVASPRRLRPAVGAVAAAFFIAVFPGNISQWANRRDGFGLDTDKKRFARLFFQPVLIAWAWWSTWESRDNTVR